MASISAAPTTSSSAPPAVNVKSQVVATTTTTNTSLKGSTLTATSASSSIAPSAPPGSASSLLSTTTEAESTSTSGDSAIKDTPASIQKPAVAASSTIMSGTSGRPHRSSVVADSSTTDGTAVDAAAAAQVAAGSAVGPSVPSPTSPNNGTSSTPGGSGGENISYSAERIIGNGSFGVVFEAKVVETNEVVAIKKVLQDKRFKNRELQIMRQLVKDPHTNIVALKHCFYSQVRLLTSTFVLTYIHNILCTLFIPIFGPGALPSSAIPLSSNLRKRKAK
jgi:hypothetical protein